MLLGLSRHSTEWNISHLWNRGNKLNKYVLQMLIHGRYKVS